MNSFDPLAPIDNLYIKINRLAHQQKKTLSKFLDYLQTKYAEDTSNLERDKDGCLKYPDGTVGISFELEPSLEQWLYEEAERKNISFNEFIIEILTNNLKKPKEKKHTSKNG